MTSSHVPPPPRRPGLIGYCLYVAVVHGGSALVKAGLAAGLLAAAVMLVLRFVDPPGSTLMLARWFAGDLNTQNWVRLEQISPNLLRAVIASEDTQFCSHRGIDFRELEAVIEKAERGGDDFARGASTITMQVAKNLFLWPGRSYARKGLELALASGLELFWPKTRTLEVYLNIVEWGPGIFGAEAAARHHFRKPAARLTQREAALLAASLPNPIERTAGRPGDGLRRIASIVEGRMAAQPARFACVLAK